MHMIHLICCPERMHILHLLCPLLLRGSLVNRLVLEVTAGVVEDSTCNFERGLVELSTDIQAIVVALKAREYCGTYSRLIMALV